MSTPPSPVNSPAAPLHSARSCSVIQYNWSGNRNGGMEYYRAIWTTPNYLNASTSWTDIADGGSNIDRGYNECGLAQNAWNISLTSPGTTSRTANITASGCSSDDDYDVIDFGPLDAPAIARTCTWYISLPGDNPINNADIRFRSTTGLYFIGSVPSGCSGRYSIEGVATHEFGHAFGLNHVSETSYPTETMSSAATSCSLADASLGRSDYAGLYDHY